MNSSLSFITRTTPVSDSPGRDREIHAGPRELTVLGYDSDARVIQLLERARGDSAHVSQAYSIRTHGRLRGRMTHENRSHAEETAQGPGAPGRGVSASGERLMPLFSVGVQHFRLDTRVTRRRAARVEDSTALIRKYDVRVTLRPIAAGKVVPMGARKTLTAYLRPRVKLVDVWAHPALEFAVAIMSYIGFPYGIGYDRQTAMYLPLQPHFYPRV